MLGTFGLQTYIWNNRLKSLILLAGFPVLLVLICFGFALVIAALNDPNVGDGINQAIASLPVIVPIAILAALVWFVIAYFANHADRGAAPLEYPRESLHQPGPHHARAAHHRYRRAQRLRERHPPGPLFDHRDARSDRRARRRRARGGARP